jgi:hypothetical protein
VGVNMEGMMVEMIKGMVMRIRITLMIVMI